jgi:hypothetical protein
MLGRPPGRPGRLLRLAFFLRTLSWGSAPSAAIILEAGLKVEAGHRQR